MSKITNPKALGKSNKANILFKLQNEGGKSRLQLAKSLHLTAAAITKQVKELIENGLIAESGSMQRNLTGRPEVLLTINIARFAAIGVNIEKDKIHISVCNYDNVIEERIFDTDKLLSDKTADELCEEIKILYEQYKDRYEILGAGVGIAGRVESIRGISVDSHGILPSPYPLLALLKKQLDLDITIINNVRAQARALISGKEDNFMYVKHAPGIGCAIVVGGKVVNGVNENAGELGHTVAERGGKLCPCGKRGCLETAVSEKSIEMQYCDLTGETMHATQIYDVYQTNAAATRIVDDSIATLAIAVGNAAVINDPKKIMVTGGLFAKDKIFEAFTKKMDELGFGSCYEIIKVGNDKKIKAYAGARHILLEKIFEV